LTLPSGASPKRDHTRPWYLSPSREAADIPQPWSLDECPISALTAPVLNWNETLLK
jgi:hypothetical protein